MRKTLLTTVSVLALGFGAAAYADDAATDDLTTDTQTQVETDADLNTGADANAETDADADMSADTDTDLDGDLSADTDTDLDAEIDADLGAADVETDMNATASTLDAFTADELIDSTVVGVDGEEIAEVSDLVLGDDNQVTDVLVNVGGFLGIGEKVVALDVNQLQVSQDDSGDTTIVTSLTEEQLEEMASFEASEDIRLQSGVDAGTY